MTTTTLLALRAGQSLEVSGNHGDAVKITGIGTDVISVTFNSEAPALKTFGPYDGDIQLKIETLVGYPKFQARQRTTIAQRTAIAMALNEKFKNIAARAHAIPKKLEERADALNARLDSVEQRGDKAFTGHEAFLDDVEKGIAAAEGALNQLTNGAPPDA